MNTFIQLSYVHDGSEYEFTFDMNSTEHRARILSILGWAARNGVEIYICALAVEPTGQADSKTIA